jgi:hypothetical protein
LEGISGTAGRLHEATSDVAAMIYVGCVRSLSLAIEGEGDVARTTGIRRET